MKVLSPSVLAGVISCLVVVSAVGYHAAQRRAPLTVTRLYTGPDGQAHAEDTDMKLTPRLGAELQERSEMFQVVGARFVRTAPGYFEDWHNPGQRQYLITLSGRAEIEVAGGQKIPLTSGRILLVEDSTGKGHRTRTLGTQDWISITVPLATQ